MKSENVFESESKFNQGRKQIFYTLTAVDLALKFFNKQKIEEKTILKGYRQYFFYYYNFFKV